MAESGRNDVMLHRSSGGHVTAADLDYLLGLERGILSARASTDPERLTAALADAFVGFTPSGFVGKAAWIAPELAISDQPLGFRISSARAVPLGAAGRLLIYRIVRVSPEAGTNAHWAASVYVREASLWRLAYHNEVPVAEPYTPALAAASAASIGARGKNAGDGITAGLLAIERHIWTARAERRAGAFGQLLVDDFVFVNPVTKEPLDKAASRAVWAGAACTLTGFSLREARGAILAEGIGILTYIGIGRGDCEGVPIEPRWITDVYIEHEGAWRSAMILETRVEAGER